MNFNGEITEQYLMKVYEDLQKECISLMNSIRHDSVSNDDSSKRETLIARQISIINSINNNLVKLKTLKKKMSE